MSPPAPTRWRLKRGIEKAVDAVVAGCPRGEGRRRDQGPDRRDRVPSPRRPQIGDHHRRRDGQGRQGGRHHRRGVQHLGPRARTHRGHALRQGLHLALLRHRPERMEAVLEDPTSWIVNSKISSVKDLLPLLEKVMQSGKPLLIIAEDVDGEALADPGRQQDPRHLQVGRRQGAWLRRPPQGHARRHRHPHRWPGHLRGGRPQARTPTSTCSAGPQGRRHQDETTIVEAPATTDRRSPAGSPRSAEIEKSDSDYDREKLQERLAARRRRRRHQGGAATEVELKERKHRIEDAVRNAKAASRRASSPVVAWRCIQATKAAFRRRSSLWRATRSTGANIVRVASRPAQADRGQRRSRGRRRGGEGAHLAAGEGLQRRDR